MSKLPHVSNLLIALERARPDDWHRLAESQDLVILDTHIKRWMIKADKSFEHYPGIPNVLGVKTDQCDCYYWTAIAAIEFSKCGHSQDLLPWPHSPSKKYVKDIVTELNLWQFLQ